jgi:outer membrane protein assembly factor BamD (BamD/ComL family)/TM2 domain-containing membrane protein YozV
MKKLFPLLLCGMLFCSHAAFAEEMSVEKMMSYADSLFERGDYYRAITEYDRAIFFYANHPLAKKARFQIALSYFKGEKLDQAIAQFRALADEYRNEELGRKAFFMVGEAYYQKRDYSRAEDVFTTFVGSYPDDPRTDAARIKIGWTHLREGNWQEAAEEFRKVPVESSLRKQAEGLAGESKNYPDIPKKSPTLAGGLSSVLPGAGQLYVGRPGDAATSFLLNGVFIWATAEAFNHRNNVTGGILLFFESGWYLGNIYNAVSSAHKYNRRSEQQFMDGLQSRYDVSFFYDGKGRGMAALTLRFQ